MKRQLLAEVSRSAPGRGLQRVFASVILMAFLVAAMLAFANVGASGDPTQPAELPYRVGLPGIARDGGTGAANNALTLQHGIVVIPSVEGVVWGFGDVPCGYGLEIDLPHNTRMCFDEGRAAIEVYDTDSRDAELVDEIVALQHGYALTTDR